MTESTQSLDVNVRSATKTKHQHVLERSFLEFVSQILPGALHSILIASTLRRYIKRQQQFPQMREVSAIQLSPE